MKTIAEQRADLEARGYVEVPKHGSLRPGARIHHHGQQWWEAMDKGTATVVAVYEKPDSAWSQSWHMADVEVIPQRDDGQGGFTWAQYHCAVARVETR